MTTHDISDLSRLALEWDGDTSTGSILRLLVKAERIGFARGVSAGAGCAVNRLNRLIPSSEGQPA